jgi:hypothetical protein
MQSTRVLPSFIKAVAGVGIMAASAGDTGSAQTVSKQTALGRTQAIGTLTLYFGR